MALDTALRVFGTMLEFFGIAIAAWGIRSTRRTWAPDVPGVEGRVRLILRRIGLSLRLIRPTPHLATAGASLTLKSAVRATVTMAPADRRRTLRQRLRRAERDIRRLEHRVNTSVDRLDDRADKLDGAVSGEARARADLAGEHRRQLRELAAGGLRLEATGLAMILTGTLLSNLSNELANAIRDTLL